ncbi:MAG TPA: hypothetical protein VG815_14765 [Chloroflexota bacterium]|nr:hypothetical protein [Chloroflexota bacterium]
MHVVDKHDQIFGTVLLVRPDHFVIRQDLASNQLVALPWHSLAGVIGGMVFLTLTPGEVETVGKVLERRERANSSGLRPRIASRPMLGELAT